MEEAWRIALELDLLLDMETLKLDVGIPDVVDGGVSTLMRANKILKLKLFYFSRKGKN